jgi:hypothetical protein
MILEGMPTLFTLNLRHAIRVLGLKHLEVHDRFVPNLQLHEAYHIFLDSKVLRSTFPNQDTKRAGLSGIVIVDCRVLISQIPIYEAPSSAHGALRKS